MNYKISVYDGSTSWVVDTPRRVVDSTLFNSRVTVASLQPTRGEWW